ncbi:hypothetical protein A3SI_01796 [Nitritalea halalkaliphila LW7]|uniref:Uncharacterized protein n=1 Tax=Nitritalea halalkaliphila LW7 TaxID=1189621 RepID=I5CAA7_9BACT|nr:hypothetical protein [Nitritalea halalkaliphila]EIM78759.1 hypothetical protein A3SI_01796 [Nitritalea halalkaliphila LW7]
MKERMHLSLQTMSFVLVSTGILYATWDPKVSLALVLTYMLVLVAFLEAASLYITRPLYPESHTTFKAGMIATFFILIGIKPWRPPYLFHLPLPFSRRTTSITST